MTVFLLELSVCAATHMLCGTIRSALRPRLNGAFKSVADHNLSLLGSDAESVSQRTDAEYAGG